MTKMWIALIVTNAIWAGWAVAQSHPYGDSIIIPATGRLMAVAAQSPAKTNTIIQTDEGGYVICSPERKPGSK